MKKYFWILLLFPLVIFSCKDDDEIIISESELPQAVQVFLSSHFPQVEKLLILEEKNGYYVVKLANNFDLEFQHDGHWVKIDGKYSAIPSTIIEVTSSSVLIEGLPMQVPESMGNYIFGPFPDLFIYKVKKEQYGYKLKLSSGWTFQFGNDGKFITAEKN